MNGLRKFPFVCRHFQYRTTPHGAIAILALNRVGYKKIADNAMQNLASLQAVQALEALARRAIVAERHADIRHGNEFVPSVYRLYAPLAIGDKLYRVKLTVKDFQQGQDARKLLHALEGVEIENAPLGTFPTSPETRVGTGQPTTVRTLSVADLLRNATQESGKPFGNGK